MQQALFFLDHDLSGRRVGYDSVNKDSWIHGKPAIKEFL
jgi:hypothetical protein